jgi:hypothetical protein
MALTVVLLVLSVLTAASTEQQVYVYHQPNCSDDTPGTVPPARPSKLPALKEVKDFIIITTTTIMIRNFHHVMKLSAFSYFNGIRVSFN